MQVKFGDKSGNRLFKNLINLLEKALRIINFKNFNENANPLFKENQIYKISDFIATKMHCLSENHSKRKIFLYLMTCLLY